MKTFKIEPFVFHTFGTEGKTIILYHGWGSSTRTYIEFASDIAELGFRVILPELPYHDSRDPLESPFRRDITQQYFWKTIFQSIDESAKFFEALQVPLEEIILLGSSMGGFIASGIAAKYPGVAGLISVNSSGSFLTSERIFRKNDNRPQLSEEEKRVFSTYDPTHKKHNPSPVLLLHGIHDSIISIEGQQEYDSYLKSCGAHVTFLTYEHVNHTITDTMIDDIKQWLIQNFKE
ncbi:alpha/beta fold hydrolase [Chungangia koreensis]|uniref:Alpha/beta fold hydrolase n=1 Tax=Chungangia koreensis TaxID=752657 RepID=A0ABV8X0P5_9LACT